MVNKHFERCSISLVMREMQIKAAIHFTPDQDGYSKKKKKKKTESIKQWRNWNTQNTAGGNVKWSSHLGKQSGTAPQMVKHRLPCDSGIVGKYPGEGLHFFWKPQGRIHSLLFQRLEAACIVGLWPPLSSSKPTGQHLQINLSFSSFLSPSLPLLLSLSLSDSASVIRSPLLNQLVVPSILFPQRTRILINRFDVLFCFHSQHNLCSYLLSFCAFTQLTLLFLFSQTSELGSNSFIFIQNVYLIQVFRAMNFFLITACFLKQKYGLNLQPFHYHNVSEILQCFSYFLFNPRVV